MIFPIQKVIYHNLKTREVFIGYKYIHNWMYKTRTKYVRIKGNYYTYDFLGVFNQRIRRIK